jgi:YebC/PmpR family DNA-binding regulatory protein
MSGHSKWSKVKHQKATTDVAKAAAFTRASRGVTLAVKLGDGVTDPNVNFRLRLAIEKAKDVNMPKENIARAISKGKGMDAGNIVEVQYEAFGPSGSAFLIESVTDNKQRTVSLVKNVLERNGGSLATPGAVSRLFRQMGVISVPRTSISGDALAVAANAGADDIGEYDEGYEFYTSGITLHKVMRQLEGEGIVIERGELVMVPIMPLDLTPEKAQPVWDLNQRLDDMDDVSDIYTNVVS